jgi:hypothetical protein
MRTIEQEDSMPTVRDKLPSQFVSFRSTEGSVVSLTEGLCNYDYSLTSKALG